MNLHLDPDSVDLCDGFTHDLRGLSSLSLQGDVVEVRIASREDLYRAAALILRSIEAD
ncbi:hypothetical protein [Streptomyces sp. NPDC001661]